MFYEIFKFFGIMTIPWCDGKPMDHTIVNVDADVEFETVFAFSMSSDSDIVPGAAVVSTKSSAVNSDIHLFSSEKPDNPIRHLTNVGDGKSFHPSLDYTMPRHIWTALSDCIAVFEMRLDAIVGLVESYF